MKATIQGRTYTVPRISALGKSITPPGELGAQVTLLRSDSRFMLVIPSTWCALAEHSQSVQQRGPDMAGSYSLGMFTTSLTLEDVGCPVDCGFEGEAEVTWDDYSATGMWTCPSCGCDSEIDRGEPREEDL